jgi:hypothetical protein
MRRWFQATLTLALLLGTALSTRGSAVAQPAGGSGHSAAAPTAVTLLELANRTGFAHPAVGVQDGMPQLLVLQFDVEVPAVNAKNVATGDATIDINDDAATGDDVPDKATVLNDLWRLYDRARRIAGGSRGGGANNGTAATRDRIEARLLAAETEQLGGLRSRLAAGEPGSAAYGKLIDELIATRQRLQRLAQSTSADIAGGAERLISELDVELERALTARADELRSILRDPDAGTAARDAAAAELIEVRNRLRHTPTGGANAGDVDGPLIDYHRSRVDALLKVLDSSTATDPEKAEALAELRKLRNALRSIEGGTDLAAGGEAGPVDELLGEIEKRLADAIRARLAQLNTVVNGTTSSDADKAEAITEMFELWQELRGLTYGQSARRDEGDTSHDDLITSLRDRLTVMIGRRYNELSSGLGEDADTTTLGNAGSELFEAWQRLRELGQTDSQLYRDLESTLREIYRVQTEQLIEVIDSSDSEAERAAAARALIGIDQRLSTLDGTRPRRGDAPYEDPTRYPIGEKLDEYVRGRIERLGGILDSRTATDEQKAAAINELRQLRSMLIDIGRQPAGAGALRSDPDLTAIDNRLRRLAVERLDRLAGTLQSSTATAAQKQQALDELEQLRGLIRDLGDPTGEIETRIDNLLKQGLDQRLQQLEGDLEGADDSGAPLTGLGGGDSVTAISLKDDPGALASSPAGLQSFGTPGGPTLAALGRSTGTSTGGDSFDFLFANAGAAARLDGNGLVVEPVSGDAARVEALWATVLERANAVVSVSPDGYCLEKEQRPPDPGELYMLASAGKQSRFNPVRDILAASTSMYDAGLLHPEDGSDPQQYFHSTRQWAIWTQERGYDQAGFTDAFVEHTRLNVEAAGYEWTPDIEQQVRELAPNRYQDVANVLTAAGFPTA